CTNQTLFHEAARLLQGLREAGIRTMVLKGLPLALLYYRDRGARPMSDVDVLVPVHQTALAIDCLARMGWRASSQSLAQDFRFRKVVRYLHERFQAPLPAHVLGRLSAHQPTYMERMEYRYLSLGPEERKRVVLGHYPFILVEYLRFAAGRSPLRKVMELPEYM